MNRRHLLLGLLSLSTLAGCDDAGEPIDFEALLAGNQEPVALPPVERDPVVAAHALPAEMRQPNWGPSCMWASMATALERCGREDLANIFRSHSGSTNVNVLEAVCKQHGIPYRISYRGDKSVLEWCAKTGHYAVIEDQPAHARDFCGMDSNYVYIVNCNDTSRVFPYYRDQWFKQMWRGWAIAPDLPVAPAPTRA